MGLLLKISAFGLSDTGRVREHNEDAFLIDAAGGLCVVADGMGGHSGGRTASHLAVEILAGELVAPAANEAPEVWMDILAQRVRRACQVIYEKAREDSGLRGMGTTVTALWVHSGQAVVAHVGDSRCYLWRDGRLSQLTDDHSLVNEQLRAGLIDADEARQSRLKNVITRSVGFEPDVAVDTLALPMQAGDRLLLTSDGLTNQVEDADLARVLARLDPAQAPTELVALANAHGGDDNITAVVIGVVESGGESGDELEPRPAPEAAPGPYSAPVAD